MPRIRTIKPEFWTDPIIVGLPMVTRLFFIGLWNFADDEGRLRNEPARLKMQIFPADDVDIQHILDELIDSGRIEVHQTDDGCQFLQISNWTRHQKISHPTPSIYKSSGILRSFPESSGALRKILSGKERKGKERKGIGEKGKKPETKPPSAGAVGPNATGGFRETQEALIAEYVAKFGPNRPYVWQGAKDSEGLKRLLATASKEEILRRWRIGLNSTGFLETRSVAQLASKFNDLVSRPNINHEKGSVRSEDVDWSTHDAKTVF